MLVILGPSSLCRQAGRSDLWVSSFSRCSCAGELTTLDLLSDEVTESLLHCCVTRIRLSQQGSCKTCFTRSLFSLEEGKHILTKDLETPS